MKFESEGFFFKCSAIWYVLTVFWGFAPSFYLLKFYEDAKPLSRPLILHGIVFSIWVLLYALQVFLIGSKRYGLHKRLGIFGLLVMILMVPSGMFPVVYKAHAGLVGIDDAGHNVFRLFSGYVLFALALVYRKKGFLHKRFILGCMVMLMSAAIFRISLDFGMENNQVFNKGFQVLPAMCLFIIDVVNYKKAVWIDLISVATVFAIFFFADSFWLSSAGNKLMDLLISVFVLPFL